MAVLSVLSRPFTSTLNVLERWVVKFSSKNVTEETDWLDSTKGSWYLHPRQHAIEFAFLSTGFASASLYYLSKVISPTSSTWAMLSTFKPIRSTASTAEKLLLASLLGSFSLTLVHKIIRKNKLFMLQPCHMGAGLLLFNLCNPNKSSIVSNLLFNIYLYTQWGGIAALVFPDLRDHNLIGETFNFFAEHILILVAPMYMVYSGRYLVMPGSKNMALLSFFVYGFFHSPVLHLCALRSGMNLNYVFSPPPVPILYKIGRGYRLTLYATALSAMCVTRFGLVDGFMSLLPSKSLLL